MNEIKRKCCYLDGSGISGLDLDLAKGYGAKLRTVTFHVNWTIDTGADSFVVALNKTHYDWTYTPLTPREQAHVESALVIWGLQRDVVTTGGHTIQTTKRIDLEHKNYVLAINPCFSAYSSNAAFYFDMVLEFENVKLSAKELALIYTWQGGII